MNKQLYNQIKNNILKFLIKTNGNKEIIFYHNIEEILKIIDNIDKVIDDMEDKYILNSIPITDKYDYTVKADFEDAILNELDNIIQNRDQKRKNE